MYAIKHYIYLHKQECELFGWLTLLSMCICRLCVCVLHCACVYVCVHVCTTGIVLLRLYFDI